MGKFVKWSIWKYVKTHGDWRYKRAVMLDGKPVENMVLVDGIAEFHPEGTYYVRLQKQWINAGTTPQSVMDEIVRLMKHDPKEEIKPLITQMGEFMEGYSLGKVPKTVQAMNTTLDRFRAVCPEIKTLKDAERRHVQRYWQWEVDNSKTHSLRSAHNRVEFLVTFFRAHDIEIKGTGMSRWRVPRFVEEEVEIYEPEELAAIMGGSDARHAAVYSTMLKGLLRDKEAVYLTWECVNVRNSTIYVKQKPQYGWKPKKNRERTVKVPHDLISQIMALPRTGELVFGTEKSRPDGHLLRDLKTIAKKVSLDPDRCWLHKFRATGATTLLRSGMDLRDVMTMGGWRDLKSVMRYLAPMTGEKLTAAVEAAWA